MNQISVSLSPKILLTRDWSMMHPVPKGQMFLKLCYVSPVLAQLNSLSVK